mmetsp:Transcript_10425/g.14611  ORF Transcript_10425/g.14611 Transcript_10425/m.14611 type:complete len:301 (+) Transcript_10425:367-1269(+)
MCCAPNEVGACSARLVWLRCQNLHRLRRGQGEKTSCLRRLDDVVSSVRTRDDEHPAVPLVLSGLCDLRLPLGCTARPAIHDDNVCLVTYEVSAHLATPLIGQGPRVQAVQKPVVHIVQAHLTPVLGLHIWTRTRAAMTPPSPLLHLLVGDMSVAEEAVHAFVVGVCTTGDCHHAFAEFIHSLVHECIVAHGVDVARLCHQCEGLSTCKGILQGLERRHRTIAGAPAFEDLCARKAQFGPLRGDVIVHSARLDVEHKPHLTRLNHVNGERGQPTRSGRFKADLGITGETLLDGFRLANEGL